MTTTCTLFSIANRSDSSGSLSVYDFICPYTHMELPVLSGGITGAYGAKASLRLYNVLISRGALARFNEPGAHPAKANVIMPDVLSQRIGISDLSNTTTLNMLRLLTDLQNLIKEIWIRNGEDCGFPAAPTERPDLINRLRKEPGFEHLKLIIYPVLADGQVLSMATYFGAPDTIKLESA